MLQLLTVQLATTISIVLFAAFALFHLLVVAGVIPYTIVWGGRLISRKEMLRAEAGSFAGLIVSTGIIVLNARALEGGTRGPLLTVGVWLVVVVFALNTVGNLAAKTRIERYAFTPVTLLLALLALRLALHPVP